jgi:hypothetical protein
MKREFKEMTEQSGAQTKNKNSNQFYLRNIYKFWCHWVSGIFSILAPRSAQEPDRFGNLIYAIKFYFSLQT